MTEHKVEPDLTVEEVRERIIAQVNALTRMEDLEFVELAISLTDITFSEEMVVEFYLEASMYVAMVQARHERAKAKLKEAEGKGGPS